VTPQQQIPQPVRKQSRGLRTSTVLLLTLLLAVVFGTVLFAAGWEFGRGSASTLTTTATQSSTTSSTTTVQSTTEAQREAVIAKVRPAIVLVNVTTASGSALGSGEIINKQGYIVTNNHVVSGANSIQVVLSDGTRAAAQLVGTDPADDLAVVKINPTTNLAVITLGDSSKLKVGQEVLAIGNPLGNTQTVTNGIISALNRSVSEGQGGATIPDAIQTDAPINPGNSGGALVDMSGNLIGIPTLTAIDPEFNTPASGVGFAIPSNRVNLVVPQIIQSGKVTHTGRAVLGVSVTSVDSTIASQYNLGVNHGALITSLVSGGAAAKAGLKTGDVIVKIDNATVNDASSLGNTLITKNPGDRVAVTIYRSGQQQTINVALGELQASQ
jgi:S1-C subfamily serine protease